MKSPDNLGTRLSPFPESFTMMVIRPSTYSIDAGESVLAFRYTRTYPPYLSHHILWSSGIDWTSGVSPSTLNSLRRTSFITPHPELPTRLKVNVFHRHTRSVSLSVSKHKPLLVYQGVLPVLSDRPSHPVSLSYSTLSIHPWCIAVGSHSRIPPTEIRI